MLIKQQQCNYYCLPMFNHDNIFSLGFFYSLLKSLLQCIHYYLFLEIYIIYLTNYQVLLNNYQINKSKQCYFICSLILHHAAIIQVEQYYSQIITWQQCFLFYFLVYYHESNISHRQCPYQLNALLLSYYYSFPLILDHVSIMVVFKYLYMLNTQQLSIHQKFTLKDHDNILFQVPLCYMLKPQPQ